MAKKKKKPILNEKQSRAESYNRFVGGINAVMDIGIVQDSINVGVFICAKSVSFVVN